ncbi:hypothetical protein SELMODRAFT_428173 [Selaginella moellendorffii]|uniref:Uncharacterized protein n=1 Tax=Selaginella moellendorffii TaxID=88036 RepID=D8T1Z7_SELML|nr:hypothetical protein SELMODRAFT_428173 [Selaginella moellendorffii]
MKVARPCLLSIALDMRRICFRGSAARFCSRPTSKYEGQELLKIGDIQHIWNLQLQGSARRTSPFEKSSVMEELSDPVAQEQNKNFKHTKVAESEWDGIPLGSSSSTAAAAAAAFATPGLLVAGIVLFLLAMVAIVTGIWITRLFEQKDYVTDTIIEKKLLSGIANKRIPQIFGPEHDKIFPFDPLLVPPELDGERIWTRSHIWWHTETDAIQPDSSIVEANKEDKMTEKKRVWGGSKLHYSST